MDFFARRRPGATNPEDPVYDKAPYSWLTWLVVKPLVKDAEGTLDRFYYAADTLQSTIAKDMAAYFNDPVNGKSILAGK